MPNGLEIRLFGGLWIAVDGNPVTGFLSAKVPALLAYLAVTTRPHQREALAGLLWGEMPEAAAANNLRQALTNLRRSFEPYLLITREIVELKQDLPCSLDVAVFDHILAPSANPPAGDRIERLHQAVELYQGDFLAGFFVRDAPEFEEWMLAQRARYRELALHALHALAQHRLESGDYDAAIHDASRLLALEPWREETHRQLMLAMARTGQSTAALAQYKRCRRLLEKELGIEPSAETTLLYERIKSSLRGLRRSLPTAATGFVGRQAELDELHRLLVSPETRLLSLLGPGGIGKTRLALEVARACEPLFLNGVWFVMLDAAQPGGADSLAQAIADALRRPLPGSAKAVTQLLAYLRTRELLIILDNLEEWEQSSAFLSELLAAAPGVKILATSRHRLNLQAERVFWLDGLPLPDPDSPALQESPAYQLFEQRARRVHADLHLSPADRKAIGRICALLQGLPLGIELAAAWMHQLTPLEIAAEIERSFDFLATSQRDALPRHRSLRAVFDWSWQRLQPEEQTVFRRLAVFRGSFSRQAAMDVTGATRPVLAALADKSLIWRRGATFLLHESARHFAWDKLEQAGEDQAIQIQHTSYYVRFLSENEARLKGHEQKAALADIASEIENVRFAWSCLVEHRDAAGINAALGGLYHFLAIRSHLREGLELFDAGRSAMQPLAAGDAQANLAYGRASARSGRFLSYLSRLSEAEILIKESLEIFRCLDVPDEIAYALGQLGGILRTKGELAQAEQLLSECLALRRENADLHGQAVALLELGGVAFVEANYEKSLARCQEGLAAAEQAGDLQTMAHLLTGISLCNRELGQMESALEFGQRGLVLYEELEDRYGVIQASLTLGELSRQLGRLEAACQYCQRAVQVSQDIGHRSGEADGYYRLGQIAAELGETQAALTQLRQGLINAGEIGETPLLLDILLEIGALLLAVGDTSPAGAVLRYIVNHPQGNDQQRSRAAALLERNPDSLPQGQGQFSLEEILAILGIPGWRSF